MSKVGEKKKRTVEEEYQKLDQREHILKRPDTYIGSIEATREKMWVLERVDEEEEETNKVVFKRIQYSPGLYKIFDEIIVNAADNKQRDPNMTKLCVTIDAEQGFVRVWNNGASIPIKVHDKEKMYVATMIFGHLLTGSNFDDAQQKTTGGRNGFGAKLANIYSTRFEVQTRDGSGKRFAQVWRDNMSVCEEPNIRSEVGEPFVCITFWPDLKIFGLESLDEDIVSLFSKRVHDIAATSSILSSGPKLKVELNGERLSYASFQQYVSIFEDISPPASFKRINKQWEIGIGTSSSSNFAFQQISFVNSVSTTKGGSHVDYITNQGS